MLRELSLTVPAEQTFDLFRALRRAETGTARGSCLILSRQNKLSYSLRVLRRAVGAATSGLLCEHGKNRKPVGSLSGYAAHNFQNLYLKIVGIMQTCNFYTQNPCIYYRTVISCN